MNRWKFAMRRYLWQVESWLPCSFKMKRSILGKIRGQIQAFCQENPNADLAALVARFGEPRQIAGTYVDELDRDRLLKDLRIRRRIVGIVAVSACAALLIWGGIGFRAYADHEVQFDGHYIDALQNEQWTDLETGEVSGEHIPGGGMVTGTKHRIYYDGKGEMQFRISLTATFRYTGTEVSCEDLRCTVTVYNPDWYEISNAETQSAPIALGDVVLGYRLLGIPVAREAVNVWITCTPTGHLT